MENTRRRTCGWRTCGGEWTAGFLATLFDRCKYNIYRYVWAEDGVDAGRGEMLVGGAELTVMVMIKNSVRATIMAEKWRGSK